MEERRDKPEGISDNLPYWLLLVKKLVHKPQVRNWCALPYPNHPKGCPNYGDKDRCPPKSPYITKVMDIDRPMYLVYSEFDLASHIERMKIKHPLWTDRQLRNVLYWQRISKKQLYQRTQQAMKLLKTNVYVLSGESLGVNLYATCFHSGLKLEKIKGLKLCRHVSILGWRRKYDWEKV